MNESQERWLPVPGYEGLYEVSDQGRILSHDLRGKPGFLRPCNNRGYRSVELKKGGVFRRMTVHKIVMLAFMGTRPDGFQVNHKNGIKDDNRFQNLEYVTASENKKHAFRTGLQTNCGEKSSQAKITAAQVIEIRHRFTEGFTTKQVAEQFGLKLPHVSGIRSGRIWKHLLPKGGTP